MDASSKFLPIAEGFPRPDWSAIAAHVQGLPEEQQQREWDAWFGKWLTGTIAQLPHDYRLSETENFSIVSSESQRYVELLGRFFERALASIMAQLDGIASNIGYDKHVRCLTSRAAAQCLLCILGYPITIVFPFVDRQDLQ